MNFEASIDEISIDDPERVDECFESLDEVRWLNIETLIDEVSMSESERVDECFESFDVVRSLILETLIDEISERVVCIEFVDLISFYALWWVLERDDGELLAQADFRINESRLIVLRKDGEWVTE